MADQKSQSLQRYPTTSQHIEDALAKGARIVIGGKPDVRGGRFFAPTILADVSQDMIVSREETFGPLAPVFRFRDEDDVIVQANNTPFGLAAYFYSRDIGRIWRVAERIEAGIACVNTGLISTELPPFGGVKSSFERTAGMTMSSRRGPAIGRSRSGG